MFNIGAWPRTNDPALKPKILKIIGAEIGMGSDTAIEATDAAMTAIDAAERKAFNGLEPSAEAQRGRVLVRVNLTTGDLRLYLEQQ